MPTPACKHRSVECIHGHVHHDCGHKTAKKNVSIATCLPTCPEASQAIPPGFGKVLKSSRILFCIECGSLIVDAVVHASWHDAFRQSVEHEVRRALAETSEQ